MDPERGPYAAAPSRRPGRRSATVRAEPASARPAVELAREGVPLNVIQRQLGHADLGVTSYLQGIDNAEVIGRIHGRTAPMMPASAGLKL